MDRAKRMQRTADRILEHLAHAGPEGLPRRNLVKAASGHDYTFGAEVLDSCLDDGRIELVASTDRRRSDRYRLTLAGVDEIAANGYSSLVDRWLNLDLKSGRQFRQTRLDITSGVDVALHTGASGERPRYRSAEGEINDKFFERIRLNFWGLALPVPEHDPAAEFWMTPAEPVSFWS